MTDGLVKGGVMLVLHITCDGNSAVLREINDISPIWHAVLQRALVRRIGFSKATELGVAVAVAVVAGSFVQGGGGLLF